MPPVIGEIALYPYNFSPAGWMRCEGQLLPISEYDTLYTLIGTTYGGDGQATFALPDLRRLGQDSGTGSASVNLPDFTPGNATMGYHISLFGVYPSPTAAIGATPFVAQLMIFAFNFAPKGFAECNGQLLPINQNQALFSLLGTTYGGNGQTTFALPDMRVAGAGGAHKGFETHPTIKYYIALQGIFPSPN